MKRFMMALMVCCAVASTFAHAASEFTVLRRSAIFIGDSGGASPSLVINFTLPSTVNVSASTANSAVLTVAVNGSEFNYNEVYVNPPTTVCTSNATDANQAGSIGMLDEHDDTNLKSEWATTHLVFSSALLDPGSNTLLICVRSVNGEAGPNVGNLDNLQVRGIVLHYHTTE